MSDGERKRRPEADWPAIEKWFVSTPGATYTQVAERFDVCPDNAAIHGSPKKGNWIKKQQAMSRLFAVATNERLTEILAQERADDIIAFKQLEFRLQKVVLTCLELLFPPPDAPIEIRQQAEARLKALTGRELSSIINEGLRTLTDTGRHRRLLAGQATAIFARADSPDVYIVEDIEQAQEIERRARRAQRALIAAAEGSPIDIDGEVIPPNPPSSA